MPTVPDNQFSCPKSMRIATPLDQVALFDLLWDQLHLDNHMGIPADPMSTMQYVKAVCDGRLGIAGVIDGPDGTIVGSVGIVPAKQWYSDQWHLSEVWMVVHVNHRNGTNYGTDLFEFAQWHRADVSARIGYDMKLDLTIMSFNRLDAKERLWRKYAKKIGAIFWIDGDEDGRR